MKTLLTLAAACVAAFAISAHAAGAASGAASAPLTKQQNKMSTCSTEFKATGKPSGERQAFMSQCLKKESNAQHAQREKMKACNTEAKGKKGDERKAFMKECLSK